MFVEIPELHADTPIHATKSITILKFTSAFEYHNVKLVFGVLIFLQSRIFNPIITRIKFELPLYLSGSDRRTTQILIGILGIEKLTTWNTVLITSDLNISPLNKARI